MLDIPLKEILSFAATMLGGGFIGNLLSEMRQRKKDSQSDTHAIIDQLQENEKRQDERIQSQDKKIDDLYDIIYSLQEEVRQSRTKAEQAEFWLSVEKETSRKLQEKLQDSETENLRLAQRTQDLLSENSRLREEVSKLETKLRQLQAKLDYTKEEPI